MKCALYARYSTERQNESSISDQFRVCERTAEREGFAVVARFDDAAISGGTARRTDYQRLLAAARRREFGAIIAEDLKRLWREQAEQWRAIKELYDLGIHIVTASGLDSRQKGFDLIVAVSGAAGELERAEAGYRTRRAQEGNAQKGRSSGGRAYGYIPAALSGTGRVEIDKEQAKVVRRIFTMYAGGASARAIANTLNAERVASPGAKHNRTERRRDGKWLGSAIAGDAARGVGLLNNELYIGRQVWGKFKWIRSAKDSAKRRCVMNAREEWVVHEDEARRIVPQALWDAVKARQRAQAAVNEALPRDDNPPRRKGRGRKDGDNVKRTGRDGSGPKFLLSGLIRCHECGARYVMGSASSYACSSYVNGGKAACANTVRFRRDAAEDAIIEGIRRELSSPAVMEKALARVRARLRELSRPQQQPASRTRMAQLEREVANMIDAIAVGGLRGSSGLAERLRVAEAELTSLRTQAKATARGSVEKLLPDLAARFTRSLARLPDVLRGDPARGREALAEHVGAMIVQPTEDEIRFVADAHHLEAALLRAASGGRNQLGSGGRI